MVLSTTLYTDHYGIIYHIIHRSLWYYLPHYTQIIMVLSTTLYIDHYGIIYHIIHRS